MVAGEVEQANGSSARRSSCAARSARRQARAHARLPDREHRPRQGARCPGNGVYGRAAVAEDGEWQLGPAATNVGVRPTFVTGRGVLVEAYLLDYDGDLYDRELRLAFLARLRGERRFDTVEALVEQMHRDVGAPGSIAAQTAASLPRRT